MGKNNMLEEFIIEHLDLGFKTLRDINEYYFDSRDVLTAKLVKAFIQLFERIKEEQTNGSKENISYIHICFLRSNFYMRNGIVRVYAFDRQFVLDTSPLWEDVDFSDLCEFLWTLEDELCLTLNRYKNKVYRSDVKALIQTEYIHKIVGRITAIAKLAVCEERIINYINEILKTDNFSILSGEYQGDFEEILVTEALNTKGLTLKEFLKIHKKEQHTFCCKQYVEQIVVQSDLKGINFTKSCFRGMDFSESDLSCSILSGTEWQRCKLVNTCWKGAALFGAAFIDSDLSGSDFSEIIAPVVPDNVYFRLIPNLDGLCFNGANLKNTNFSGADLRGADFRGAQFHHTDFSGAYLVGAVFNKDALSEVELSPDQLNQIRK